MSLIDLILLAIALGIDCLVVSFSQGLIFNTNRQENSLKLALTMGLFQGLMPVLGYVGTDYISELLMPFKQLIIFSIFLLLGVHFIFEAFTCSGSCKKLHCIGWECLLGFGIATSIDALVSGITLNLTSSSLLTSCILIGLVSFVMSICGFWGGSLFKNLPERNLQILGGLILIFLAVKSLIF